MSHIEDVQKWLEEVMSELIQNLRLNKARYEISESVDYTMSTLYYINIKYKNRTNGEIEELPVVLKSLNQSKFVRRLNQLDRQIHNEILFYQTYAQSNDHFVKCFYADERSPCEVLVLENGGKRGYSSCPYSYDVPLEYTLAAFREMGRFHGKGYVTKELLPEKFFDIVKRIQETRYETDTYKTNTYKDFINIITPRAVEYLRRHGHDAAFCDKMEALLSNAFDEVMLKVSKPLAEPLSTLCHGDFTASNVLFKRESDGQYRAILIDFAHFRYATPVVDLSTYLCLCCSNELRKGKFSKIMRAYHNALKEYLLEAGIWDIEKYSYEVLLDNFKKGALFGFAIASFFLGVLTGHSDRAGSELIKMEYVERAKLMKQYGGDEISKILADMLLHLRDLGCLKHF